MDFQPKKRAQTKTTIFADERASRPPVAGTIARGELEESEPYYLGYTPEEVALVPAPATARMVALQDADQKDAASDDADKSEQASATAALPDEGQAPAPAAQGSDKPKQEQAAKPAEDKPAEDKPADAKPAQAEAAQSKSVQEKPAQEKPAQEKPAQENAAAAAKPAGGQEQAGQAAAADAEAAEPERNWLTEFPFDSADAQVMALGKRKFETNCAVCHGFAGNGDGLVSQRALQLAEGYWVQPTSLHDPRVQKQPVGKIYDTITNGRGKMAPYGPVLTPQERWAIVLYVKALQRSRDAKLEDVPEAQRAKLTTATPAK